MSNISLPDGFLEGSSLNDKKITAFATKRIEPIFNGPTQYANKVTFSIEGEYLPQGVGQNIPNQAVIGIKTFLDTFSTLNNGNCTLSNVTLNEANWIGHVPYTVECECYTFMDDNANRTIDAKNEISVTENLDGTISINRSINVSAISINGSSAVSDARGFAQLLSGQVSNWRLNYSTSNKGGNFNSIILNSSSETADISNGSYSIQQNFTANLLSKDISKKGIVKHSIEIQSGVDGLATMNVKSNVIGGINTTENDLKSLVKTNSFQPPAGFNAISNTASYDDVQKSMEINTTFSNDLTITKNGNKVSNSLSFNFDFLNQTTNAVFNSESRPATIIQNTDQTKTDLSKDISKYIKDYNPLAQELVLETISDGAGVVTQVSTYSENYIKSPSIIGGTQGVQFYDLSLNVDYQPGFPQNSFMPILSGKGNYYLEDLDYSNNSIINTSIQGKYKDDAPQKTFFENASKSGDLANLSKTLLLKDEMGIDGQNKSFSYVIQKVGNDATFKDLK
jgi:hypothetical protein